jgi:predicted phage tail protein
MPGDGYINLTWQPPSSDGGSAITNYLIRRAMTSGAETFHADAGNQLWFNDTGLINGQTYYYMIRAENVQGVGPNSNEAFATPGQAGNVPSAPQNLAAAAGDSYVTLTWYAPSQSGSSAITAYKVYRGTTPGSETLLATLGNVLTYTDASLTNDQTYYYRVSAVNSAGEGSLTAETSAIPHAPSTDSGDNTLNYVMIGAGVAILAIVGGLIYLMMRRKK